jgi:hypothetical protein
MAVLPIIITRERKKRIWIRDKTITDNAVKKMEYDELYKFLFDS